MMVDWKAYLFTWIMLTAKKFWWVPLIPLVVGIIMGWAWLVGVSGVVFILGLFASAMAKRLRVQ